METPLETENLVSADEAQRLLDTAPKLMPPADGGPDLLDRVDIVVAMTAEIVRLGAIIEGRTTPPTDAEFATHDAAGGSWRIVTHAVGTRILAEDGYQRDVAMWAHAEMLRDAMAPGGPLHGADVRWWALDAEGRPCAWPVVSQ